MTGDGTMPLDWTQLEGARQLRLGGVTGRDWTIGNSRAKNVRVRIKAQIMNIALNVISIRIINVRHRDE